MNKTRNYVREEAFWISSAKDKIYTDLYLPIENLEFYVKGNKVACSQINGVFLNEKPIQSDTFVISKGDTLQFLGYTLVFYETQLELTGNLETSTSKLLETEKEPEPFPDYPYYKRSPRIIYQLKTEKVEIKAPPTKPNLTKKGIFQVMLPALTTAGFTAVMGYFLGRGPMIYMGVGMTIIMLIFNTKKFLQNRKEKKLETKRRQEMYEDYLLGIREKIRKKRRAEREALDYQNPTPQAIEHMILQVASSRLYERTLLDDDFLQVNLGYCQGKSNVEIAFSKNELSIDQDELIEMAREITKEHGKINQIPVTIDLKKAHLGLVGSKVNVHKYLKYLLQHLTFFQSYHDVQFIFLYHEDDRDTFSYTRWYPHLKIQGLNVNGGIYNENARDQILGSLHQILKERKQKLEEEKQEMLFAPYFIFIIDEPKLILNHPIMEYLQDGVQDLGFRIIYTMDKRENLPENIKTVCLLENSEDGRLLLSEGIRVNRAFSQVSLDNLDLEGMSRSLSAIIHEQGMSSKIPEAITFFEMYQITHPQELRVKQRWKTNQSHKSLAVPLGVRAKEDYVELNLHEKAHGPHGLVAGTTGSGKSEIVQSYILSLAVNFHPHEVGFLLIDYKGGGMANLFAKLPHLLGTITNLDKAESMRALVSIKSELARRQQIFSDHDVNHINSYNKLFKLGKVTEPLPHLFLISDEFAELKKEQPDFMKELVSAARIGRSLGIHLILATQKPSGVVDDQVWTNSKFKLCLKVQNTADSREMLKTPDAANIVEPGRSYLQVGNNEIYELFQSAWSGAIYDGDQTEEEKEDDRVYLVNELGQGELLNKDLSKPVESNQIKATQLDVVVDHLAEVYEEERPIPVKKPWLPSLTSPMASPHTLQVLDSATFAKGDYQLGIGIIDIPEEQTQVEYILDLVKNGHLLYMASSGYGKSVLLSNIIVGLAMKNAVKNLHMYIIDFGNSALIPLRGLPHVADYIGLDDSEKLRKLQKLIIEEVVTRKRLLAQAMAQNFNVYNESQSTPLKAIVIAVDNYDVVNELNEATLKFLQKVSRDGASLGIYLIMTLSRESMMRSATKGNFKERIAGYNFVAGDNQSFIGRSKIELSEDKHGQALIKRDQVNMMQLYTPVDFENEISYNANLQALIKQVKEASSEEKAKGIPTLPDDLYYDMLPQYPAYEHSLTMLPVGIDVVDLEVKYLDVKKEPALIIGNGGMGRTNMLRNILHHLAGQQIYLFDNKSGDLMTYVNRAKLHYAKAEDAQKLLDVVKEVITKITELYEEIPNQTLTLKAFGQTLKPVFVIIDGLQELNETLGDEGIDVFAEAVQCGVYVIVTADLKFKVKKGKLTGMLTESKHGLVVGNLKEQGVFSSGGLREENRQVDLGYYHVRGDNQKVKLIEYREMRLIEAKNDETARV